MDIFVSTRDRLDKGHANHLAGFDHVRVHEIAEGGHGVVKVLRDEGKLPGLLRGEFVSAEAERSA